MTIYGCKEFERLVHNNGKDMTDDEVRQSAIHALTCDTPECKKVCEIVGNAKSYEELKQLAGYTAPKRMFDND